MTRQKLWTPTFLILTFANFVASLALYLIIVKIIAFSTYAYGVSYGMAGLSVTAFSFSAVLTRALLGRKIDEWGSKKSILIGFTLLSVAGLLYLARVNFAFLLAVRVLNGVGFAIATGALGAAAAMVIPSDRHAEGIGYFTMAQAVSTGVGPFAAVALTQDNPDCAPVFVCLAAGSILALVLPPPSQTKARARRANAPPLTQILGPKNPLTFSPLLRASCVATSI